MNTSLIVQYAIVVLMVLGSVWVVLKKQFPSAQRRLQATFAQWLLKQKRSAKIQALGRRLAPPVQLGNTCGGCDNCPPRRGKQH